MRKKLKITLFVLAIGILIIAQNIFSQASANLIIPKALIERQIKQIDPSIMTTIKKVQYMLKKNRKVFLVDVRSREKFNKVHIPGSFNIPLFAVITKTFLKSRPIVLIGKGHEYNQMEKEIKRLKKRGFKVKILNGGITAWYQKKGPIQGNHLELSTYNKITPLEFFLEKNFDKWLVVNISKKESRDVKKVLPYAAHIPLSNGITNVKRIISLLQTSKMKEHKYRSILILSENGDGYERVEKELLKAISINTFYMQGGVKNYKQFLQNLALSKRPKSKRTKTVGDCGDCTKRIEE